MSRIHTIFLLLTLSLLASAPASAADTTVVQRTLSGTTFLTERGDTIRLLGVATGTPRTSASDNEARDYLALIITGRRVILISDSLVPDPPAGPKPRYVYLTDGVLVNMSMIVLEYGDAAEEPRHSMLDAFQKSARVARQRREESTSKSAPERERSTAVRCSGITKKGTQCKRMTTNASGRCWQHE